MFILNNDDANNWQLFNEKMIVVDKHWCDVFSGGRSKGR